MVVAGADSAAPICHVMPSQATGHLPFEAEEADGRGGGSTGARTGGAGADAGVEKDDDGYDTQAGSGGGAGGVKATGDAMRNEIAAPNIRSTSRAALPPLNPTTLHGNPVQHATSSNSG